MVESVVDILGPLIRLFLKKFLEALILRLGRRWQRPLRPQFAIVTEVSLDVNVLADLAHRKMGLVEQVEEFDVLPLFTQGERTRRHVA